MRELRNNGVSPWTDRTTHIHTHTLLPIPPAFFRPSRSRNFTILTCEGISLVFPEARAWFMKVQGSREVVGKISRIKGCERDFLKIYIFSMLFLEDAIFELETVLIELEIFCIFYSCYT